MLLALDNDRVKHDAAIIHGDVTSNGDSSGFSINLDDRNMGAKRECRSILVEHMVSGELFPVRFNMLGNVRPAENRRGNACDVEASCAHVNDNVSDVCFKLLGGD